MRLFLDIMVIVFEILYYSIFMKKSRSEGKFSRYIVLFILFSITSFFMNDGSLVNYMLILLLILYGLKYIVKLDISLYDLLFIFIMMLFKLAIELTFAFGINYIVNDILIAKTLLGVIKVAMISGIGNGLSNLYTKLHLCWNDNKFFIRYIFDILMFIYVISACLFLIKFR